MKTKAILTILISLLVGFILGFLTEGQIVKNNRNKLRRISYSQMFENRVLQKINPTEVQKEQILPVIKSYSQKMSEFRKITSQKLDSLRTEMNNELKQHITDEQYARLTVRRDRHQDSRGHRKPKASSNQNKESENK